MTDSACFFIHSAAKSLPHIPTSALRRCLQKNCKLDSTVLYSNVQTMPAKNRKHDSTVRYSNVHTIPASRLQGKQKQHQINSRKTAPDGTFINTVKRQCTDYLLLLVQLCFWLNCFILFWCPVFGQKADQYHTSHFSPFNCCLHVALQLKKRGLNLNFACCV